MKNDLDKLQLDKNGNGEGGGAALQDEFKVSILGKIRKSTYYIIARGIKFGFDTKFLLYEC